MSLILTLPNRLALCLKDCHPAVKNAYPYTEENLDYLKRPCFLVGAGEERFLYDESASEQTYYDTTTQVDFVGEPFTAVDRDYNHHYEVIAREIAAAAVLYLLKRPQLQFSNLRGDAALEQLPPLAGVLWCRPDSRSTVTLMQRGGIEEAFWGFTLSLTSRCMFTENEDEIIIQEGDEEDDSGL